MRGSINILENPDADEEDPIESVDTEIPSVLTKNEEFSEEEMEVDGSDHFDNFLDVQEHFVPPEIKKEIIEEDFIKVEIKAEPDVENLIQDEWNFLNDDIFQLKNDPEINELKTKLDMTEHLHPVVLLDRLPNEIISTWTNIKQEGEEYPERKRSYVKRESRPMPRDSYKRFCEARRIARNRKIKGHPYICDICGFQSKTKQRMKKHMIGHKKERKQYRYRCKICNETFSRSMYWTEHMRKIHGAASLYENLSKDYVCDLCGKDYYTITQMRSHIYLTHCTEFHFECTECPRKFKTKAYLDRHKENVHNKNLRYPCLYCGKLFKKNFQLKSHELQHTMERELCKICGKMVRNMKNHLKTTHNQNKKRPELIPCPTCGKGFSKFTLQLHIDRVHFKKIDAQTMIRHCPSCDATFTRVDDLRR